MKVKNMILEIEIPEGIEVAIEGHKVKIKGPKGEVERRFAHPGTTIQKKDNRIVLNSEDATKREKTMLGTFRAHIRNIFKGVKEGHVYKLKICSGHFPMNVSINGKDISISNFLGEKTPRTMTLKDGVNVKIDGQDVIVESVNKELAGQAAANIETLTKIKGRDKRIFQDGIYITEKDGKVLE